MRKKGPLFGPFLHGDKDKVTMCGPAVSVLTRAFDHGHLLSMPSTQGKDHPPADAELLL